MAAAVQDVLLVTVTDETKWKRTPLRSIRMEDDLWSGLDSAATDNGFDRSSLVRQLVRWYLGVPEAQLPQRPKAPSPDSAGMPEAASPGTRSNPT